MDITKLTERGFVALVNKKPYWIAADGVGKPWLYVWENQEKRWVEVRQLTVADVTTYNIYRVSEAMAQFYHNGNHTNRCFGQEIPKEDEQAHIISDIDRFKQVIINSIENCMTLDDLKKRLANFVEQLSNY